MTLPTYDPGEAWIWTKAVTKKEKYGEGLLYESPDGIGLYEKAICKTEDRCQASTKASQYEPGAAAEKGGPWGIDKTSRFTRTGTSLLEKTWQGNNAGRVLSRANGVMEGASRGLKVLGVVGVVAAVGYDVYDIATAPPARRKQVAAVDVGELAGGIAGGVIGAAVGGPVGAVVGGYLGGLAGKAMGSGVARLFGW